MMPTQPPPPKGRRRRRRLILGLCVLGVVLAAAIVERVVSSRLRDAIVDTLLADPDAGVSVDEVDVSLARLRLEIRGLGVADPGGLRFARVRRCSIAFGLGSLRRDVVAVRRILLEGLDVRVDAAALAAYPGGIRAGGSPASGRAREPRFVVNRLEVRDARIVLLDERGRERFAGRFEEAIFGGLGTAAEPLLLGDVFTAALAGILDAAGLPGSAEGRPSVPGIQGASGAP